MSKHRPCPTCGGPIDRGPGQHAYCSDECRPQCAAPGCDRPTRGNTEVCEKHRVQLRRTGSLVPKWEWSNDWVCVVCGQEVPKGSGRRSHCSGRCQMMASRARRGFYKNHQYQRRQQQRRRHERMKRPQSYDCVKCGKTVDLNIPVTKTGRFKRIDSKLCDKCKHRTRSKMTVGQLVQRDGINCKICGEVVDMAATAKDLFRPSIDHIVPRAHGGTNDPENLQLAHLWCNQVKHTRQEFSLLNDTNPVVTGAD